MTHWLSKVFGWFPPFNVRTDVDFPIWNQAPGYPSYAGSAAIAAIAVAAMIFPMATSVMREVFAEAPLGEKEAALALGGTRWAVVRHVVLPFGKSGIIGGSMLALGRALGETISVVLVITQTFEIKIRVLEAGTSTISSLIATGYKEATPAQLSALLTAGFLLFVTTMAVNGLAAAVVARSRSGAESEISSVDVLTVEKVLSDDGLGPEQLRRPGRATREDRLTYLGAVVASLSLTWLVYTQILPFTGRLGFIVSWYALFVILLGVLTALDRPRAVVVDRVISTLVAAAPVIVGLVLASTVISTAWKGIEPLMHLNFYTQDMAGVRATDSFDKGGILHAIVGTVIQVSIAVMIAMPLGITTAVFTSEVGGRTSRWVRAVVEAMTAMPSIVAGLFIYTVCIVHLGMPTSGFAASLALTVMALPIMARASDVVLRVVPGGLREASYALGATKWQTVWHVVLPTAPTRSRNGVDPRCGPDRRRDRAVAADIGCIDVPDGQSLSRAHELVAVVHLQRGVLRLPDVRGAWLRRSRRAAGRGPQSVRVRAPGGTQKARKL
ncbi:ABC transporter permease subunit [Aeromicrobium sp. UC242_57]|uniref:phosphate ABC transporter permease n=1 Tax=Aeromicrobium sp. UC242_57 TaxID=3374624 RepID=UPI003798C0CC